MSFMVGARSARQHPVLRLAAYVSLPLFVALLLSRGPKRTSLAKRVLAVDHISNSARGLTGPDSPRPPSGPTLFIGILARCDAERRELQRKGWIRALQSHSQSDYAVVEFILSEECSKSSEADVLRVPAMESYQQLWPKSLAVMQRGVELGARYMLKTDDDVHVHVDNLRTMLASNTLTGDYVLGNVCSTCRPHRDGPWSVQVSDWRPHFFPPFAFGAAYVVPWHTAQLLHRLSQSQGVRVLSVEDVTLGLWVHALNTLYGQSVSFVHDARWDNVGRCQQENLVTHHLTIAQQACIADLSAGDGVCRCVEATTT